jgi:hypothetical protein
MAKTEQLQPNNEASTGLIVTILLPIITLIIADLAYVANPSSYEPIVAGGGIIFGLSAAGTYLHHIFSNHPHDNL